MATNSEDVFYAWIAQEPNGRWGFVTAIMPGLNMGPVPLHSHTREHMELPEVRAMARHHARQTGRPVKLVTYHLADTLDVINP